MATQTKTKIHTQYRLADGTKVPGVTTTLGILAKPALLDWAWRCGLAGDDYKLVRDSAARVGTLAHYLVLCHLKDERPELDSYSPEDVDKAENCLLSYFEWEKTRRVVPLLIEVSLVSEEYKFGGTIDCYARIDSELVLLDYKTGKGIYPEMIYQVSAYCRLLEEMGDEMQKVRILRIGRTEDENFEDRLIGEGELEKGWNIFKHCLAIYNLQKKGV